MEKRERLAVVIAPMTMLFDVIFMTSHICQLYIFKQASYNNYNIAFKHSCCKRKNWNIN